MTAVAVDWSGAKRASRKLWLAEASKGQLLRLERIRSRDEVVHELVLHCARDPDTVVGIDFAFSMPEWFINSLGLPSVSQLWAHVEQMGEDWLRECNAPFWGRAGKRRPTLHAHFRATEAEASRVPGSSPKSVFQINGVGAVGTGSIRGMPILPRLHRAGISVWPFDHATLPFAVEIYPRLLTGSIVKSSGEARLKHMNQHWPGITGSMRVEAAGSEDSFDAAVSALVMDQHWEELRQLDPLAEPLRLLEGEIWFPSSLKNRSL